MISWPILQECFSAAADLTMYGGLIVGGATVLWYGKEEQHCSTPSL
jgi:hypothetical protein